MSDQAEEFRLAVVATVYRPLSHADVIASRWLQPRAHDADWGWPRPRGRIVSMSVAQRPDNDMAGAVSRRHGVPLYDSVDEALCLGGDRLGVDGVLLIGEHGDYPSNDIGQLLYPRKELFDGIVSVFRRSNRAVPVFCDKHLSWNFDWGRQMVDTAREMGFLFFSSSSIPLCRRVPPVALAGRGRAREAVAVFHGPDEAYGYHSCEFVQSIIERRVGGETGVEAVTVHRGDDAVRLLDDVGPRRELLDAAITAVRREKPAQVKYGDAWTNCSREDGRPTAVCFEYRDGLRVTHVNLSGHVSGWGVAIRIEGEDDLLATSARQDDGTFFHAHFATLCRTIDDAFLDGRLPFAPQRGLLTTGMTAFAMQAAARPGTRLETPDLHIAYDAQAYPPLRHW